MTFKNSEKRRYDTVVKLWVRDRWPVDLIARKMSLSVEQVAAMLDAYIEGEPPQELGALVR